MVIGKQIRKYRLAKKLTQKQLADLVGLSTSYLSGLEHGDGTKGSSVSMKNICNIAEVLGVSLDDLAYTNIEFPKFHDSNSTVNEIAREINSLSHKKLVLYNKIVAILAE